MYYKKFLEPLKMWGVFRGVCGLHGEHVCIASNITELDADRILAELSMGKKDMTKGPMQLDTRIVIQIIGLPRFDLDRVLEAFDECEGGARLICIRTNWLEEECIF